MALLIRKLFFVIVLLKKYY